MTFAFDEQFTMFDITPVENQFIMEYLPGAKGEYVKVYLYGLLCCYHPKKEIDLQRMSQELNQTEEEIQAAFRYWERRGIVRRISDHPPEWEYINIKQISFAGTDQLDREYVRFSRDLQSSFEDRDLYGSEIAACYEWKEDLGIPTEVIVMLLKYMSRTRGKNFRIKDAEKIALMLKDEKAFTLEDAEDVLSRDEIMIAGFRKVQRKLGMRFNPSEANLKLYRKWVVEWHFTQKAVEEACDRTGTSTPSLALVDSILEQAYRYSGGTAEKLDSEDLLASEEQRKRLKEALNEVGQFGPVTPAQQKLYAQMTALYPQEIILLAARECAAKQKRFDSVLMLLKSWQERGFTDEKQIQEHISAFHEKEQFLKELRSKWAGRDTDIGQKSLQLLDKWENQLGFSREMISLAADLAFEMKKPVAYMDKTLGYWAGKGIRTPEDAEADRKAHREQYQQNAGKGASKTVSAQEYTQRDYSGEQEEAMIRMISSMNGGEENA